MGPYDGARHVQHRPRSALGSIGAVAEAHGCVVVTNNQKDFPGIESFNPLRSGT